MNRTNKMKLAVGDRAFLGFCYTLVLLLTLLVLYPLIYVFSASVSSANAVLSGRMWLWPVDISLIGFEYMLQYKYIWVGYMNTIIYTVGGTSLGIIMTLICAYPLSRGNLRGRGLLTFIFTFTMIFSGGMIPSYMLMRNIGLLNTRWVMIVPGCMSVYNMIVTRTFIQNTISNELLEAARIDGCTDFKFFVKMVLPLSTTIVAVLAIMYAAGHWNSYFNAFLYLNNKDYYPLQIFLRQILVQSDFETDMLDPEAAAQLQTLQQSLKYSVIVIAIVPMLSLYPFAQKYFQKGMMIGALKG